MATPYGSLRGLDSLVIASTSSGRTVPDSPGVGEGFGVSVGIGLDVGVGSGGGAAQALVSRIALRITIVVGFMPSPGVLDGLHYTGREFLPYPSPEVFSRQDMPVNRHTLGIYLVCRAYTIANYCV